MSFIKNQTDNIELIRENNENNKNSDLLTDLDVSANILFQKFKIGLKYYLIGEGYNDKKNLISQKECEIALLKVDCNNCLNELNILINKSANSFASTISNVLNNSSDSSSISSYMRLSKADKIKEFERASQINFKKEMLELKIKGKKESINILEDEIREIERDELFEIIEDEIKLEHLMKEKTEL